uniref:Uncharacterized protein n=1 Tax=Trichuris muris TaxID=70415 RepID=A0A5S6QS43_TRIMR
MDECLSPLELYALPISLREKLQGCFVSLAETKALLERQLDEKVREKDDLQMQLDTAFAKNTQLERRNSQNEDKLLQKSKELVSLMACLRGTRSEANEIKLSVTKLTSEKENMSDTISQQREDLTRLKEKLTEERAKVQNLAKENAALELRLIGTNAQLVRQKEQEQRFAAFVKSANEQRRKHNEELCAVAELMAMVRRQANDRCLKAEEAHVLCKSQLGALKIENATLKQAVKHGQERAEKLQTLMLEEQKRHSLETMKFMDKIFRLECSVSDDMKLMQQYYERAAKLEEERKAAIMSVQCNRKIAKQTVSRLSSMQKDYELRLSMKDKQIAQLSSEIQLFLKVGDGTAAHTVALDRRGNGQTEICAVTFTTLYHEYWLLVKMLLVTKAKFYRLKTKFKHFLNLTEEGSEPDATLKDESVDVSASSEPESPVAESEDISANLSTALAMELPNLVEAFLEPEGEGTSGALFTYLDEDDSINQRIREVENYQSLLSLGMFEQEASADSKETLTIPLLVKRLEVHPFSAQPIEALNSSWKAYVQSKAENARLEEECRRCSLLLADQEVQLKSLNEMVKSLTETVTTLHGNKEQMELASDLAEERYSRLQEELSAQKRFHAVLSSHNTEFEQSLADASSKLVSMEGELRDQAARLNYRNLLTGMINDLRASLENIQNSNMEALNENLVTLTSRQESLVNMAKEASEQNEMARATSTFYVDLFRGKMKKMLTLKRRAEEQSSRYKNRYLALKKKVKRWLGQNCEDWKLQEMNRLHRQIANMEITQRRQNSRLVQLTKDLNTKEAEMKYWKEAGKSAVRDLEAIVTEKAKERESLELQLKEQLDKTTQLSYHAGKLTKAMEVANAEATARKVEHTNLLQEAHNRIASLADQVCAYQTERDSLRSRVDALEVDKSSLLRTVETQSSEMEEMQRRHAGELTRLNAEMKSLKESSKETEDQLKVAKDELLDFKGKMVVEHMALLREVNNSRKQIADLEKVKEQLYGRTAVADDPLSVGVSSDKADTDVVRFLEEERKQAIDRCARAEAELLRTRVKASRLESRILQMGVAQNEESAALKMEVEKKSKEIEALSSQLGQMNEAVCTLQAQLEEAMVRLHHNENVLALRQAQFGWVQGEDPHGSRNRASRQKDQCPHPWLRRC